MTIDDIGGMSMRFNEEQTKHILELCEKHLVRDAASKVGHKVLWLRVITDFEDKYKDMQLHRGEVKMVLDQHSSMKEIISNKYGEVEKDEIKLKTRTINEKQEEVLEVYASISSKHNKTKEHIMETLGYDVSTLTFIEFKESNWGTIEKPMFGYSIKVRPKTAKDLTVDDMVDALNRVTTYVEPFIPYSEPLEQRDEVTIIQITDTHIGSDYSYADKLPKAVERAVEWALNNGSEKVILAFTGDIIHVDNKSKTTDRGTQLEMTMTVGEMVTYAYDIVEESINRAARIMPVDVYWVQGNHSRGLEGALFEGLARIFRDVDHITWNVDESLRKALLYGKNLIGLEHSDAPKKTRFSWMQYEFTELWGQATTFEILGGHFHAEEVDTDGKQVYRVGKAFTGRDLYSYSQRYQEFLPKLTTYTYDKETGLSGIKYI